MRRCQTHRGTESRDTTNNQGSLQDSKDFREKTNPKNIIKMIKDQNKNLSLGDWKILSSRSDSSGQTLVCLIDEVTTKAIKNLGNRVFLDLGRIALVILARDNPKGPPGQSPA